MHKASMYEAGHYSKIGKAAALNLANWKARALHPFSMRLKQLARIISEILIGAAICIGLQASSFQSADAQNGREPSGDAPIVIETIPPDPRGGRAYELVYLVKAPIQSYWKFKTDFDNDFLVENKYIREHKFISRNGNSIITENKYANGPDKYFRWRTTVYPESNRLEFVLLNPEDCGQRFHFGHIRLEAVEQGTRVVQTAYFDFFGAAFWAGFPWRGGMRYFLTYTAQWEQQIVLRLKERYENESSE